MSVCAWEVSIPSRSRKAGGSRARATLVLHDEDELEEIAIPIVVARKLKGFTELGELPREEILSRLSDVQRACAKEQMFSCLERRDLSVEEVKRRLASLGFPRFAQDYAIEVGKRCEVLDDERYAQRFARGKSLGGWGQRRIEQALGRRGVDVSGLEGWPEEFIDVDGEYGRAMAVASRKRVREPNAYAKLVRFLLGRGFSYGIAKSAAQSVLERGSE